MPHDRTADAPPEQPIPWPLRAFCFALMGPACAINAAFIVLAIPAAAPLGIPALVAAGCVGAAAGVIPARWLARKIHDGIRHD